MHHFETCPQGRDDRLFGVHVRVKLVLGLLLLGLVILSKGILFPASVTMVCLVLVLWTGIRPKDYLMRFGEPAVIAAILFLLKAFSSGGHVLFNFGLGNLHLSLSAEGLLEGARLTARIIGAVSILVVVGMTTPLVSLLSALAWLKVPRTFIEILLFAYRYIFVLFDDARVVYASQKNRLGYSGFLRRLRSFGTLTGAVLLRSLEQSANTATAMVQRGYTGHLHLDDPDRVQWPEIVQAFLLFVILSGYFLMAEGMLL